LCGIQKILNFDGLFKKKKEILIDFLVLKSLFPYHEIPMVSLFIFSFFILCVGVGGCDGVVICCV
jgi:hypothetical protein